jgi:hypothetical protein
MTETHIAGELYGLSAHPGDIYHRAAMTVEMLTRERDAEKADAAKWFAEYMALSHKQKGPVPDAALQARITKLEAACRLILPLLDKGGYPTEADLIRAALKEPVASLREAGLTKPNCPNLEEGKHD